ncbi:MAG TPA: hypothetical protein VL993_14860 [Stellaceae bacterium]|nr:hypothetical protein [Stellaceae bacterium]
MARPSDAVTWTHLIALMGVVSVIAIAVIGGSLGLLHSDLGDLRVELRQTRTEITQSISDVGKQAAATNAKLDLLYQEMQRQRR